jgi:hypothetical protein
MKRGEYLVKKGDLIWGLTLAAFVAFLLFPATHQIFMQVTTDHPYISGFIKFALLATMGELLAIRIVKGRWEQPEGILWRAAIWGVLGVVITLMFQIFAQGVTAAIENGYLPGRGNKLAFALQVSAIMNLTFAPTFMAFHRFTDTWLDQRYERRRIPKVAEVVDKIDWKGFISFIVMKTLPLFWIPAHTITFMLAPEYRVLMAAFLSIALGAILSFAKKKSK